MTSNEFVIWFTGYSEGIGDNKVTPEQWELVKIKLKEVDDSIPLGGIISDHNTFKVHEPYPKWQQPHTINPYYIGDVPQVNLPFISTNPNGTGGNPTPPTFTITTTPGSGSISIGTNGFGSTSTTYGYPSGSAWSYTNATNAPPYTTGDGMDDIE
jgi:hypothetical protein